MSNAAENEVDRHCMEFAGNVPEETPCYTDNAGSCALSAGLLLRQVQRGEVVRAAGMDCIDYALRDLLEAQAILRKEAA